MAVAHVSPPPASDEQLVSRVLSGERDAFDQLYERYAGRVFRFVEKRMRNRADAEESTQEVFIQVFNSLGSFRGEAPFAAWVLGIARHTVAARFKKKRHPTVPLDTTEPDGEGEDDSLPGAASRQATPLDFYELRERLEGLESRLERDLTEEQRRLFELHHLENRSIADIAMTLHKSEDAVKSNLYRARKLLLAR